MKQRIRRKQHDAEEGHGIIQTPFGQTPQSIFEAEVNPNPPLQSKRDRSPVLPQNPRRFDQIPLFPAHNNASVQRSEDEHLRANLTSPVQRLVRTQLRTPVGHPGHRDVSSPAIQNRSLHAQSNLNSFHGHGHSSGISSPTLQAKDFSNSHEIEQYQQQGIARSPLQLKAIAYPSTVIQRNDKVNDKDGDGTDSAETHTYDVPTFTRENSLSSVDGNNISFDPVAVDISDEQDDETADYPGQGGLNADSLDNATLSSDKLDAHNNANSKGQKSPQSASGNSQNNQTNTSSNASKGGLWKRFKKKMKSGKDSLKKKMRGEKGNAMRNVPLAAAQSFYIADGVTSLNRIDSASNGLDMVADGSMLGVSMTQVLEAILSTTWCGLCLGANLIKGFHYQKRRKKAYKKSWDATGFKEDKKGKVLAPLPEDQHQDTIRLGRLAKYAYHKSNRAFWNTMIRCVLQIVRLIAYLITALSGGTTAVVTGAIALGSRITENLMSLGRKAKGVWKLLSGTKGKKRKKHADELLMLARAGNHQAAQTIMDVNPFSEFLTKTTSGAANKIKKNFGMGISRKIGEKGNNWKSLTLPRPINADELIQQLQNGGIYGRKKRQDPDGQKRLDQLSDILKSPETKSKFDQVLDPQKDSGQKTLNNNLKSISKGDNGQDTPQGIPQDIPQDTVQDSSQAANPNTNVAPRSRKTPNLLDRAQRRNEVSAKAIMALWDETTWGTSETPMPKPTGWKHLIYELQPGGLYSGSDSFPPMRNKKLAAALKRSMLSQ